MTDASLNDIVRRFKDGDEAAFEEIVLACQDRVYNLCRQMLGSKRDAEDAAQDAFIKAYKNLNNFEPSASFFSWLYRIAVNTCLDYKRRPATRSFFMPSGDGGFTVEPRSNQPSPEDLYESKRLGKAIDQGLNMISEKLRAVIVLREIEGLPYEEIAEILGISVGTVKSRLSRGRDELRKCLKGVL